jgi:hypothetical protein
MMYMSAGLSHVDTGSKGGEDEEQVKNNSAWSCRSIASVLGAIHQPDQASHWMGRYSVIKMATLWMDRYGSRSNQQRRA